MIPSDLGDVRVDGVTRLDAMRTFTWISHAPPSCKCNEPKTTAVPLMLSFICTQAQRSSAGVIKKHVFSHPRGKSEVTSGAPYPSIPGIYSNHFLRENV